MATPAERALWFPESARVKVQTWWVVMIDGEAVTAYRKREDAELHVSIWHPVRPNVEIIEREMRHYGA